MGEREQQLVTVVLTLDELERIIRLVGWARGSYHFDDEDVAVAEKLRKTLMDIRWGLSNFP